MASVDKLKLSTITWDSDKDPAKFSRFVEDFSAMVRMLGRAGELIEDFLDQKLAHHSSHSRKTTPSFILDDPQFGVRSYAVISFLGWKCGNCTSNGLDFHTKEANPMEMISKAAKQSFAWAEWEFLLLCEVLTQEGCYFQGTCWELRQAEPGQQFLKK